VAERANRLRNYYVHTRELRGAAQMAQRENTGQDAQKIRLARPLRAKKRGVRFGTLSLYAMREGPNAGCAQPDDAGYWS
jgi:hypothetical protein